MEALPWIGTVLKETGSRSKARSRRSGAKLTDDDLTAINGKRDQLEGKIQERYGLAKDQARKEIDDWYGSQSW
jgi:CsbD-like